jgi:hypothetical protein
MPRRPSEPGKRVRQARAAPAAAEGERLDGSAAGRSLRACPVPTRGRIRRMGRGTQLSVARRLGTPRRRLASVRLSCVACLGDSYGHVFDAPRDLPGHLKHAQHSPVPWIRCRAEHVGTPTWDDRDAVAPAGVDRLVGHRAGAHASVQPHARNAGRGAVLDDAGRCVCMCHDHHAVDAIGDGWRSTRRPRLLPRSGSRRRPRGQRRAGGGRSDSRAGWCRARLLRRRCAPERGIRQRLRGGWACTQHPPRRPEAHRDISPQRHPYYYAGKPVLSSRRRQRAPSAAPLPRDPSASRRPGRAAR